jgi:DNA-binding PadR family transcriptional regulator
MQSKTAFVLLGILKEKPMNPYEIIKILEKLNISQWSPISSSSVYATIRTLEKNGQISGEKLRTSAMPEKTVYTVTRAGITAFLKALREYLGKDITDITKFNLGTLFLCHLEKQDVIYILGERADLIADNIKATEATYHACQKQPVPEYALSSLVHNISFYNAELSSVKAMQKEIEKAGDWNHFLTGGLDR